MTVTHTHTHPETVAVLGAGGTMGFPIARNIARAGIPVRAWHRAEWPAACPVVQMSTIGQVATKRCAELANRAGVGSVDAPVLGDRQPAEQRNLIVLESGPEEARPRTQPVFDAIADRTVWAGQVGGGSRLKLHIETGGDPESGAT